MDFPFALKGVQVVKTAGTAADGAVYYIDAPPQDVTYTYVVDNTGEAAGLPWSSATVWSTTAVAR
ncbi:MAG: hypothetical protein R3A10_16155 [Caldilineaceae bacterium]